MIRRGRTSPEFGTWLAIQLRGRVSSGGNHFPIFYADVGKRPTWRHLLMCNDTSRPSEQKRTARSNWA